MAISQTTTGPVRPLPGAVPPNGAVGGRINLGAGDIFRSAADAFPTVPANVMRALQMQHVELPGENGTTEGKTVLDRLLIDMSAVDPSTMEPKRLLRDLEFVRELLVRSPDAPRRIAAAFQPDAPQSDLLAAAAMVKAIGLTEEDSIKAGGGLIILVLALVGAIGLAAGSVAVNYAAGIKYKQAVARASGSDANTGVISNQ